jgi:hypothetical protein
VHDLSLTAVVEGLEDLFHDVSRLSLPKAADNFHSVENAAPSEVFHDNVEIFIVLEVFEDFDDSWMIN